MDFATALAEAIEAVKGRTRFPIMENILEAITDDEIGYAVLDALDEINSFEPETKFTLVDVWTQEDTRWKRLLLLGANKNSILTLLNDWTQRGFDVDIANGEIRQEDRRERINDLYSTLNDRFDDLLDRLKRTSQRFAKGFTSQNNNALLLNTSSTIRRTINNRFF